jgi:hypothetical protein
LLGDEESVWSVLRDPERSALPENEKGLLRFVAKVTKDLPSVTAADSEQFTWDGLERRRDLLHDQRVRVVQFLQSVDYGIGSSCGVA